MSTQHELGSDSVTTGTVEGVKSLVILVIGKTGNGKSSLCNTIFGEMEVRVFAEGRSMTFTTTETQEKTIERDGYRLTVVDTPDVSNLYWAGHQMQQEVQKWKNTIRDFPYVVLLAVRCDVRYVAEEYQGYLEFLRLWGDDSVKSRLVVAFTFGDRQIDDIGEELKTVCRELKNVLRDAGGRYVVFNKSDTAEQKAVKVRELLKIVEFMKNEPVSWSRKVKRILFLLLLAGVLFACGVTADITFLAAVSGLTFFVILLVTICIRRRLTGNTGFRMQTLKEKATAGHS